MEWETVENGTKKPDKLPYKVSLKDNNLMCFAGLYEDIADAEGMFIRTCTMLTTQSVNPLKKIHHRQPIIIEANDIETWLNKDSHIDVIQALLQPNNLLEINRLDQKFNKSKAEDISKDPSIIATIKT